MAAPALDKKVVGPPWDVKNLALYQFYCCPECEYRSQTDSLFKAHLCSTHEVIPEDDQDESENFDPKDNLDEHVAEVHPELAQSSESQQCPHCKEEFDGVVQLFNHIKDHHKIDIERSLKTDSIKKECQDQSKSTTREGEQSQTEKPKTSTSPLKPTFQCEECSSILASAEMLASHVRREHNDLSDSDDMDQDDSYYCQACGANFSTSEELEDHIDYAHDVSASNFMQQEMVVPPVPSGSGEEWRCQFCDELFKRKRSLSSHITWKHIKGGGKVYTCKDCDIVCHNLK